MSGSVLLHDLKKFADSGLQLRLPVDLIPPTQYGQLTNAIPRIEGRLETREGLTLVSQFSVQYPITELGRSFNSGTHADQVVTATGTNSFIGRPIVVVITDGLGNFAVGSYSVNVTSSSGGSLGSVLGIFPFVSAPGFTSPGSDHFAAAVGYIQPIGVLGLSYIHTIHRLNQSVQGITGSRLVGAGTNLFTADLPTGNVFSVVPVLLSGRPLSMLDFRFTLDTATWAIFTDGVTQYKYRNPYIFLLGNPVPSAPATATAGAAGNLNSTGGTDYDWRYTWYDGYVETEGNPSPSPDSGTIETKTSTSQINPDPAYNGGGAFMFTNNAFTGVSNTGGVGTATQDGGKTPASANSINQASCIWTGFANPATTPFVITLSVSWQAAIAHPDTAPIQVQILYSTNAGASFTLFALATNVSSGPNVSTVNLPLGTDLTQVQVLVYGFCNAHNYGGVFHPGGNFTVTVTNIEIDCNLSPTPTLLALVNQQAVVCVTQPSPNDGRITGIRLYRRGGSLPDNWRRVGTFPLSGLVQGACGVGTLEIIDNVGDTALSTQAILELDNDQPVSSVNVTNQTLSFMWGPAGIEARVLGCGDPGRPECVYFSKPGNADAWPPENFIEVSSPGTPIIAGCVWNTRIFAFSNENIFELVEGLNPNSVYTPFQTPSTHGLISEWGLVAATAMFFVAKDGIYESTGGQEVSIVENDIKPIFPTYDAPGQNIEGYEAVDMSATDSIRLRWHNNELYFIYSGLTTGIRRMLIYDTLKKRWRAASYTSSVSNVYSEPATVSSLLMGTVGGGLYQSLGDEDPDELDVIQNGVIRQSSTITGVTLTLGNYFAVMTRNDVSGEVAISPEFGPITVDATFGITAVFPVSIADTQSWRVYYGTTQGNEAHFTEFPDASLPLNRTVTIVAQGQAGTPPITPPNTDIQVQLRTGAHDQGAPLNRKQYSNVIFDLDPGGADVNHPVIITPFINGEVQQNASIVVTGTGRQQVPLNLADFFAFNVEYQVQWAEHHTDPILYQYDTLYFNEPVGLKHWAMQPFSYEFPGYSHARDAYIAIRSTDVVQLRFIMDEDLTTAQIYNLPSTGGLRQKIYVQFASNKWKEVRLMLDSTSEFRVYESDLEFRVKPWLSVLGYSVQRPFAEQIP